MEQENLPVVVPDRPFRTLWNSVPKLNALAGLTVLLVTLAGTCFQSVIGSRFTKLEAQDSAFDARLTVHERAQAGSEGKIDMLVRLRCLSMTRPQAVFMNVCENYKTAEDTMRRRGR